MPSGKGDGFPPNQKDWIMDHMPDYLAKTIPGKRHIPGKAPPMDDPDLLDWVHARRGEFEVAFKDDLDAVIATGSTTAKGIRERFDAKFRNEKAKLWSKLRKTMATTSLSANSQPPLQSAVATTSQLSASSATSNATTLLWNAVLKGAKITGKSLFEEDRRTAVSAEVNATRKVGSIDHKQHVGLLKSRLKGDWEALGDRQKEWEEKAEEIRSAEKDGLLYRNQAVAIDSVQGLLRSLIGPISEANYKIGNARFHVLYAYRDERELLKTGSIDVTDEGLAQIPFEAFNEGYAEITESWIACSRSTVSCNYALNNGEPQAAFDHDAIGLPLFPPISENTITPDELRSTLSNFIQAQWEFMHMQGCDASTAIPDIPWMDGKFKSYLSTSIKDLPNPSIATVVSLYELLSTIRAHQTDTSGIALFDAKSSGTQLSSTGKLSQQPPSRVHPQQFSRPSQPNPCSRLQATSQENQIVTPPPPQPEPQPQPTKTPPPPEPLQPSLSLPPSPVPEPLDDFHPPLSPLTPVPSVQGSVESTPTRDQEQLEATRNGEGRKRKINAGAADNVLLPSKRVKPTDDAVPDVSSRRSTRPRKKEVGPASSSTGIKSLRPALTRTGKPAKGWVELESDD